MKDKIHLTLEEFIKILIVGIIFLIAVALVVVIKKRVVTGKQVVDKMNTVINTTSNPNYDDFLPVFQQNQQ